MREALAVFDALHNRRGRAATLVYLAGIAIDEGAADAALPQLAESLRLYRELDRGPPRSRMPRSVRSRRSAEG